MTLEEICRQLNLTYSGSPSMEINHICSLEDIGPGGLAFLSDPSVLKALDTPDGVFSNHQKSLTQIDPRVPCAIMIPTKMPDMGYNVIYSDDPLVSHVEATNLLYPGVNRLQSISKYAFVDPSAEIGENVTLDPGVVIYPGVKIGAGTVLRANVVVMNNTIIGRDCLIYPNVSIREECMIGHRVILHSGVVIGADGFGFFQRNNHNQKIPQIGNVVIENDVEIGANSCVDRARFSHTTIKENTKLDNLVHIAHNVEVGAESLITAQSGIAGSTKTGPYLMMGGQSGIRDNLVIGERVTLLARTLVTSKTNNRETLAGMPSRPYSKWRHMQASLSQLENLFDRIRGIEQFLRKLGFQKNEK